MKSETYFLLFTSLPTQPTRKLHRTANFALKQRLSYGKPRLDNTGKESDSETGLYYFGARYLDPKTGRWLSGDPAVSEYIPSAPVNEEARKRNGSLPGMGGVFNYVNLHVYHYAGNNPVKYVDPDGNDSIVPITLNAWQGIQAHNTAYPYISRSLREHGYNNVITNKAMRIILDGPVVRRLRPDAQAFGSNTVKYWELKQAGAGSGSTSANNAVEYYMRMAERSGITAEAGEALGLIANAVPVDGLNNVFINIYSNEPGVILYDAYEVRPDNNGFSLNNEDVMLILTIVSALLLVATMGELAPVVLLF